ncbi:MAG: serine/threonine protein phosphatase [Bacteroidetes bacterium]|nr:serine/threonine protein phosphatase [Bacteroidota bacterium]
MKRILVIGDIHGGLIALKQVLDKASVTTNDRLIFLGDYVDGWSDAAEVVEYAMQLEQQQDCIFIKGNHDLWCEEWLQTNNIDTTWYEHGGAETIKSYEKLNAESKNRHLLFFKKMKYFFIDDKNRLFIHAGFQSALGPQKEFSYDEILWDRSLWQTALITDKKLKSSSLLLPKRLELFTEIYIGHTPTLYVGSTEPMHAQNVWNIDTGAAFTGPLSMMDVDTKQFWQSDIVKNLYPGEVGRNKHF